MTSESAAKPTEFVYPNGDFELTADYYVPNVPSDGSRQLPLS